MSQTPYVLRHDATKRPEAVPSHPYEFSLDPFQEHAFGAIAKGENVLVCAKTGSGKTLVGEYQIHVSLSKGKRVYYTSPIKSLSNQKFHDLKVLFPEHTVGIMTGDIKFCPDAQVVVMTTEILRNLLYKKDTSTEQLGLTASLTMDNVDAVIFDECHYMNDPERGKVWEETMVLLPVDVRLVLLSATLHRPERIAAWLGELKKVPIHLIETQYRVVPLTHYVMAKGDSPTKDIGPTKDTSPTKSDSPTKDDNPAKSEIPDKLQLIMDEKEHYREHVYSEWLRHRGQEEKEHRQYQQRVKEARQREAKGAVEGKVQPTHYLHRLNRTVQLLQEKELLPALLFVFSRKQCETYAAHIEKSLLDTSDSAAVRHIISFHLHRYREELEQTPQYHQLIELLYRGIAFHHSGLLPILKETVEILFSKGFVKLLVCTETFAVGLNMPTKTVIFAGLKKYDDRWDALRVLRNDEYLQMAGRAGRRGKDDRGVVIYLPEGEPLTANEMGAMMKGAKPEVNSRMDFHVDFVLKTLHAFSGKTLPWLNRIQATFWYQEYTREHSAFEARAEEIQRQRDAIPRPEPFWSETLKRRELEQQIKHTANAARKDLQRQLDSLKNRQLGPQWKRTLEDVLKAEAIEADATRMKEERVWLGTPMTRVEESIGFLRACGFVENDQERLTLKGILATEVNEGHPILLTEFYLSKGQEGWTEEEWVAILSVFLEHKERTSSQDEASWSDLDLSPRVRGVLQEMEKSATQLQEAETAWCSEDRGLSWKCTPQWVEPMTRWMNGESSAVLCQTYGLFEGNFYRSLTKLINLVNEVNAMATYCQHVEVVDRLVCVSERLRRSRWTGESLYLRL